MPEYLSPGVYIEEINTGPRPIESVGTACAGFVGFAPAGPANQPQLVTSWTQFVELFGKADESGRRSPHLPGFYMSHAIYGYFLNGGGRCYVTRVVPPNAFSALPPPSVQLPSRAAKDVPVLTITSRGAPGPITVEVAPPTGETPPDGAFTLKLRSGQVEESYENVTTGKRGGRDVVKTVNGASKLVEVAETPEARTATDRLPEVGIFTIEEPAALAAPEVGPGDMIGRVDERTGVEGLEVAEDVTMLCCPDLMGAYEQKLLDREQVKAVQLAMINLAERMGDRIAIIDPLPELRPQEAKKWRLEETNYDSMFAALYYPWITVINPDTGEKMSIPPSGHIAGVYARNDTTRGVHKAPANEVIRGALGPSYQLTKGEQDELNPNGVNCIRSFTGRGVRVWGARTLSSDPAWRYISVRRLFNMVEKSIERGTQWVVFEPNDRGLWSRVRRDVGAYLTTLWRDGMLFGDTPQEAFYVKCDDELNPPEMRDRGLLIIEVGLAPVKPAEFVVFRFSQISGGGA